MSSRPGSPTRVAGAGLALLMALTCAQAGASNNSAQVREQRQKEISAKSEAERARLERNFKLFRELSPADQDKLRRLDRELKEDARVNGQLQEVMNRYYDWFLTLTPGQAQDLSSEVDPNKREKMVRELLAEQQKQSQATGAPQVGRTPRGFSDEDLKAVLKVLEEALREKTLSHEDIQKLDGKTESARQDPKKELGREVLLMELAYPPHRGIGKPPWASDEVVDSMILSISNENQARHIRMAGPDQRPWNIYWMLWGNIWSKYERLKPDQQTLERFFVELPSAKQDEIMRLTYDQQQQKLTHMFLEQMSKNDPDTYPPLPWLRPGARGGMRGMGSQRGGPITPRDAGGTNKKARRQKSDK